MKIKLAVVIDIEGADEKSVDWIKEELLYRLERSEGGVKSTVLTARCYEVKVGEEK